MPPKTNPFSMWLESRYHDAIPEDY